MSPICKPVVVTMTTDGHLSLQLWFQFIRLINRSIFLKPSTTRFSSPIDDMHMKPYAERYKFKTLVNTEIKQRESPSLV